MTAWKQEAGLLKAFLWARRAQLMLLLLCTAVFALVLGLFKAPLEAALYAGLLCLVALLMIGLVQYLGLRNRHKALLRLLDTLPDSLSLLPEPRDLLEKDYHQLLAAMESLYTKRVTQEDFRYQAMTDYITLWGHQVKTPLSAMGLLLAREEGEKGSALKEELFKIDRYVDMALNYMKLEAGADDFRFQSVPLKAAASQAVRRYARFFVVKRLSLQVDIPEEARVVSDDKQLLFVLEQLLSNALKYTEKGGITLSWQEESQCLTLTDTGRGIKAEDLPLITQQGFTGYNGHVDRQATGIGLYLCQKICGRLGIQMDIASAYGEGTTVTLKFLKALQP